MRLTFALLLLGSLVTSASPQEPTCTCSPTPSRTRMPARKQQFLPTHRFGETVAHQHYFGRGAAGLGRW